MNKLVLILCLCVTGCVVVTSHPYKAVARDGVIKTEHCTPSYSHTIKLDEGVALAIAMTNPDFDHLIVEINIDLAEKSSLRFLDSTVKLENLDNGSVLYGKVESFFHPISGLTEARWEPTALLTGHLPFYANVNFGKVFPKRFSLQLPTMQTHNKRITLSPQLFEMQEERSVVGILCGL